jgi:hypothetical protein
LSLPWGIGRFDGEHGSKSSGDPLNGDPDFPSPRLCHTSALGHDNTIACTMADRQSNRLRCCGQLQNSANAENAAVLTGAASVAAVPPVEPFTLGFDGTKLQGTIITFQNPNTSDDKSL